MKDFCASGVLIWDEYTRFGVVIKKLHRISFCVTVQSRKVPNLNAEGGSMQKNEKDIVIKVETVCRVCRTEHRFEVEVFFDTPEGTARIIFEKWEGIHKGISPKCIPNAITKEDKTKVMASILKVKIVDSRCLCLHG